MNGAIAMEKALSRLENALPNDLTDDELELRLGGQIETNFDDSNTSSLFDLSMPD